MSLQQVGNRLIVKDTKTARSRRLVSLSGMVVEELKKHRSRQNELKKLLGDAYNDSNLVCAQNDGRPLSLDNFSKAFVEILGKAGLPRIRLHDLRHTHATILLSQNVHPKIVSERLGHSTVGITLDTYSHMLPGLQEEAARKFEAALKPAPSKDMGG